MGRVFIGYSRQSASKVSQLAQDIEALGHQVWYDVELSGGQAWWDQILAAIRGTDIFVFVMHPASLESTACRREYEYAGALGKPILPVLVADGISINLLPPVLQKTQHIDYRGQDRQTAFALGRALADLPVAPPLPDPLPEAPPVPVSYLGSLSAKIEAARPLTLDEQNSLVIELRRGLRNPADANDIRTLLRKLKARADLYAQVDRDVDEMLHGPEFNFVGNAGPSQPNVPAGPPQPMRGPPGMAQPMPFQAAVMSQPMPQATPGPFTPPMQPGPYPGPQPGYQQQAREKSRDIWNDFGWAVVWAFPIWFVILIGLGMLAAITHPNDPMFAEQLGETAALPTLLLALILGGVGSFMAWLPGSGPTASRRPFGRLFFFGTLWTLGFFLGIAFFAGFMGGLTGQSDADMDALLASITGPAFILSLLVSIAGSWLGWLPGTRAKA